MSDWPISATNHNAPAGGWFGGTMANEEYSISRRMLLAGAAGATVLAASGAVNPVFAIERGGTRRFPKDFRWGVATAAHQKIRRAHV